MPEAKETPLFEPYKNERMPLGMQFRSNGMVIRIQSLDLDHSFTITKTGQNINMRRYTPIGYLDFFPYGEAAGKQPQPEKTHIAVARFVKGLNDFFEVYNDPYADESPAYLIAGLDQVGATPEFAKFLEKSFGFGIDNREGRLVAVGNTREVMDKVRELNSKSEVVAKITKRAEAELGKSIPPGRWNSIDT